MTLISSASSLGDVFTTLKANGKQIRRTAEEAMREFIERNLANRPKLLDSDEIAIMVPLQPQTPNSESGKNLISQTKEFLQIYSLMFQTQCPQQYDRAVTIIAGNSQANDQIKYNCFSHMRVTKNKKGGHEADAILVHGPHGAWTVITGCGPGGMRVAIPAFRCVKQWGGEDDSVDLAEVGLVLRPNLFLHSLSWGEKIFIELFLPFLAEDNVSMDKIVACEPPFETLFWGVAEEL